MTQENLTTPYYIVYETRLRHRNLELIAGVKTLGVNIIMAFKANALWRIRHYQAI